MRFLLICLLPLSIVALEFDSENMKLKFTYTDVDEESAIWGLDFLDDKNLVYTTQNGKLVRYHLENGSKENLRPKLENLYVGGQGGLLDVLIHEDKIYLSFSESFKGKYRTALAYSDSKEISFTKVFSADNLSSNSHHFGSRLLVHNSKLYMTLGDRGERSKAQVENVHNGKVMQFELKQGVPSNPGIYSIGHRNPQGIANYRDKIYVGEFGPQGGDEINLLQKSHNYGWPLISYGQEYGGGEIGKDKGLTMPLYYWVPSISFSGINFYTKNKLEAWQGDLFLACLATRHLRRLELKTGKQEKLLEKLKERIRMVRQSPNGDLYLSFDSGKLGYITKR